MLPDSLRKMPMSRSLLQLGGGLDCERVGPEGDKGPSVVAWNQLWNGCFFKMHLLCGERNWICRMVWCLQVSAFLKPFSIYLLNQLPVRTRDPWGVQAGRVTFESMGRLSLVYHFVTRGMQRRSFESSESAEIQDVGWWMVKNGAASPCNFYMYPQYRWGIILATHATNLT